MFIQHLTLLVHLQRSIVAAQTLATSKPIGSKKSGRVLSLIKWTLWYKSNLLIQRMLQLHEVVCQFKYYNADDIHFSKVVYTYNFFTINC